MRVKRALFVLIAGLLAAAVLPGAVGAAGRPTFLPAHCVDQVVRPVVVMPCGQLRQQFEALRWSRWGQRRATASGWLYTNTCVPDCPSGAGDIARVRVTADRLRHCRNGTRQYTRLRYVPAAKGALRAGTVSLPCAG